MRPAAWAAGWKALRDPFHKAVSAGRRVQDVRRHPLVGTTFLLVGVALLALGALARDAPPFLEKSPLPPEVVVPFILWQLATWALLFGFFFLRPRGRTAQKRRWARLT